MSRTVAMARQVSELTGFLLHVSFALRPGKFVVGRLLAAAGKSQSAAFPAGVVNPGRRVVLGLSSTTTSSFGDGSSLTGSPLVESSSHLLCIIV